MGRKLEKPWDDFKTDTYSIPGVSEVRHRKEPGWKEPSKQKIDFKLIAAALIVLALLIAAFLFFNA